jgi:hypothetical protein
MGFNLMDVLLQENILGFEIAMDQLGLAQGDEPGQQLLGKHPHQSGAETAELVLFDQLVEIHAEQFKHQAQMLPVDERVLQPQDMIVVVFVELSIQLVSRQLLGQFGQKRKSCDCSPDPGRTPPSCFD